MLRNSVAVACARCLFCSEWGGQPGPAGLVRGHYGAGVWRGGVPETRGPAIATLSAVTSLKHLERGRKAVRDSRGSIISGLTQSVPLRDVLFAVSVKSPFAKTKSVRKARSYRVPTPHRDGVGVRSRAHEPATQAQGTRGRRIPVTQWMSECRNVGMSDRLSGGHV